MCAWVNQLISCTGILFSAILKNKTCVALKRVCTPLRFRTCCQLHTGLILRYGRGRYLASSALRTQKKTRHSSVAVLRRHALNDDVIVERHRFRVEWELAVFPIFWSFNPWMAPKQDPKPKFQEGNGAPVWFGAWVFVSFGGENGPKPPRALGLALSEETTGAAAAAA